MEESPNLSPTLSSVGLGAWAFGGVGWGPQDDEDSISTVHRAVASGVNWIDTAAVYGDGHAERIVGQAVAGLPPDERPLVFTKGGLRIDPESGSTYRDLRPQSLRAECEDSLRRLRAERIDLYQLHWPVDDREIVEAAWSALGELQREGKIRWAGVSNFDAGLLESCAQIRRIDSAQLPFSLLERKAMASVLPWLDEHAVPALVYSPLESGLLSGQFSLARLAALPEGDWRRRRPRFQSPQIERALSLVDMLRPIAADAGATPAELAIAWTLHGTGVTGAIVGARSAPQVDGWIGAATLRLEPAVLAAIADAIAAAERPGPVDRLASMPGQSTGAEVHPNDEVRRLREENLRFRDLLVAKDAELGALKGQVAQLEAGTARLLNIVTRIRSLVPGSVWRALSSVLRRLSRG